MLRFSSEINKKKIKISQISNVECISPILSVLNQLVKFHNIFNHGGEISAFNKLFAECKLNLNLKTIYAYCVYSAISKSQKQLTYCLKIASF